MSEPQRPAPEPVETDEVRVVVVGTVLFAIGLVLTLVLHERLAEHGHGDWVWITACGVLLGLVGVRTVRRRRDAARREAVGDPSTRGTDPNPP